jgi:hypothetical protein
MLPKSQRWAYVGYDEGSKSIKYYDASTWNVLTSRNFHFLIPSSSSPPDKIAIEPPEVDDLQLEGGNDDDNQRIATDRSNENNADLRFA